HRRFLGNEDRYFTRPVGSNSFFTGLLAAYVLRAIFPIYVIIFFSLFLSCLLFAHSIKRGRWVAHNLAFIFLALTAAELYFEYEKASDPSWEYVRTDQLDGLGYTNRPGTFRSIKTYGFGSHRLSLKQTGALAMFFGDSFTFGQGVNDDETLPNAFS